uniref:PDZ domain-containing protein n=1 Tax=Trichobilharzia regenti TaxID=157069 RepID=A0AA85K7A6_TRIRE|nr:unnamed protein product [Trichobilharzia regenti]
MKYSYTLSAYFNWHTEAEFTCYSETQSGSPSEGVLQSGDAILSINGENARSLSHEEATQKIRSAGTDLQLTVARRQTCDLSDIRPKGLLKFTAPQSSRR